MGQFAETLITWGLDLMMMMVTTKPNLRAKTFLAELDEELMDNNKS